MELFDLVSAGKIVNEPKQTFALADAAARAKPSVSRCWCLEKP